MFTRHTLICAVHFVAVILIVRFLGTSLLWLSLRYFRNVVDPIVGVIIACLTLQITKKMFLREEVYPGNKAVVITGCDSGFGNALAKRLYSKGFQVFACCHSPEGPGPAELQKNRSDKLKIVSLDVKSDESVRKAAEFVKSNLGQNSLWAVVNNAGIQNGFSIDFSTIKDFQDVLDVNAVGPVRVTKAFLSLLKEQKEGRVVNVTSLAGRVSIPYLMPYCMSKFAAVSFTECLRREMEVWGIRAISIEPGHFQTPLFSPESVGKRLESAIAAADDDIKAQYGDEFMQTLVESKVKLTQLSGSDVHKVVDALDSAVSLEHPDCVYSPSANTFIQIVSYFFMQQPFWIQDFLLEIVNFLVSLPKPKGVKKQS